MERARTDYTPTTDTVRATYARHHSKCEPCGETTAALVAEFDRWLAAHDREVAARTLRELHAEMSTDWHVYETRDIGRAFLADSVLERLEDAADAIERGEDV